MTIQSERASRAGAAKPRQKEGNMTRQQMYRELERMSQQVDWNTKEGIHRYNEKAREYRKMVEEDEEEKECYTEHLKQAEPRWCVP